MPALDRPEAGKAMQRVIEALLTRGRCDLPDTSSIPFAQVEKVVRLDNVRGLRGQLGRG
jgi:hypothetical protein